MACIASVSQTATIFIDPAPGSCFTEKFKALNALACGDFVERSATEILIVKHHLTSKLTCSMYIRDSIVSSSNQIQQTLPHQLLSI